MYYILLTANALICAVGTLMMRCGGKDLTFSFDLLRMLREGWLWLAGMVICWIAGLGFALLLTRMQVTDALSWYVPLVYVMVMLGGVFLLRETFSLHKITGLVCVLVGLILLLRR